MWGVITNFFGKTTTATVTTSTTIITDKPPDQDFIIINNNSMDNMDTLETKQVRPPLSYSIIFILLSSPMMI